METVLERQRHAHEEIERLEAAISDRLLAHPRTIRDRLQLDHEMADMLERIQVRSHTLKEIYADLDQARSIEVAELSAAGLEFFYKQLSSIKDFHQRYPDNTVEDLARQLEIDLPDPNMPVDPDDRIAKLFSGEESFGRYLDLNSLHTEFINLKRNRTISYARYLDIFDSFDTDALPIYVKHDPKYGQYLVRLLDYVVSFCKRTAAMEQHDQTSAELNAAFETEWKTGKLGDGGVSVGTAPGDGIWCDICKKQYSKQTVYDGHLNSKKHQAGLKAIPNGGPSRATLHANLSDASASANSKKEIARKEWLISKLGIKLKKVKAATQENVRRKQTLTDKEWLAEQANSENLTLLPSSKRKDTGAGGDEREDSDSDDDEKIYNPLKLPLGWDGKPIPFWLWRLHGLGVEYPCEICGNHIYMGRKAFDRHFIEARHVHGLRCLGISGGSALFDQITVIADAVALHGKMEEEKRKVEKSRDDGIEMEDDSGNVMSAKVYKDLVDQGIL